MKRRLIWASAAILVLSGAPALAEGGKGAGHGARHGAHMFERLDSDKSGGVSLDEFVGGANHRFSRMDANGDDTITDAEIDAHIAKRVERIKQRILKRLDADGDGTVTRAEFEARRKERFASLDADGNGQIEKPEASAAYKGHGRHHGRHHGKQGGRHHGKHNRHRHRGGQDKE